jgi:hypothetical protein
MNSIIVKDANDMIALSNLRPGECFMFPEADETMVMMVLEPDTSCINVDKSSENIPIVNLADGHTFVCDEIQKVLRYRIEIEAVKY